MRRRASERPPLLERYESLLPTRPDGTIVLVADERSGRSVVELLDAFHERHVVVLAEEPEPEWRIRWRRKVEFRKAGPKALDRQLQPFSRIDLIVNLRTATGAAHLRQWRTLFLHLREGGAYVVARERIRGNSTAGAPSLVRRLSRIAPLVGAPRAEVIARFGQPDAALVRATGSVLIAADYLVVTKRGSHLLKVRDADATRLLAQRADGELTVTPLATLASGTLVGGAVTSYGESRPLRAMEPSLPYPAMHLRRYEGRVCVGPGGVVHDDHSVFPDAFRWHLHSNLPQARLDHADSRFAMLREQNMPLRTLEGRYYYLDYSNAGHFGHLLTEAMAKFWGWPLAKERDPALKVLLRTPTRFPDRPEPRLETRLLEAYGVPREDMVWIDEPVWVESLVAATPMWHNAPPFYAHPGMREVWDRIGDRVRDDGAPAYERIFVTRPPSGNRACHNVAAVEEVFARHGFEIVRPERYDLSTQAGIFSRARVVAGLAGSGMFNLMYARQLSTLIVLAQEAYTARNEYLYGALLGADIHYLWSTPDITEHAKDAPSVPHQSSWSFDFDRVGSELERLLSALA